MTTWRDDPLFVEQWGGFSGDLAWELADDAVAAYKRWLASEIEEQGDKP